VTQEKRLMTIEDINKIKYVEDPKISPDGQWIAYVVRNVNPQKKGYDTNIYLVATTSGEPLQLTRSGKDSAPCWSPDGTQLAFVSSRNEKPQIHILPMDKPGEPRTLTSHDNGAFAPAWSPDGKQIAYLVNMNAAEIAQEDSSEKPTAPKDEIEGKHRKERKAEDEKNRFDPRVIERIPYRQGTSFMDDRHPQIYVIPTAEGLKDDAAKPRRLTNNVADYGAPVWSKSGRHLITSRSYNPDADEPARQRNLYLIEVESGIERRIKDDENNYYDAIPSQDGNWLAAHRMNRPSVDDLIRFTLIPLEGGEFIDLNLELDRPIEQSDWTSDDKLVVVVATQGRHEIHQLDPHSKTFTPIVADDQTIFALNLGNDGSIAYVAGTAMHPDELFYKPADGAPRQMTTVNQGFLDEVRVLETHEICYPNKSGNEIQGWYILPPDYEAGKKYPLALNIHGGPRGMWSPATHAIWHEWQTHAAEGYVVFYCNPRGSEGYGEQHIKALNTAWGDVAMEDIMAGVDLLIEKGIVDENRMALSGGSYGGYMTAWIIGHTDRFKVACSQRGVYNLISMYGTTDIPFFIGGWFDSLPWLDVDKFWQHSPLAYAHNIKTPLLILHSENDFRVPIEQGEQLFAWIRRATDTPVKMIRFPREGHELSRSGEPEHRMRRLREMMNWFNTYIQPEKVQPVQENVLVAEVDD
jgi:dipeptidyl aminopeptidase/acylaminoacyl peptidase